MPQVRAERFIRLDPETAFALSQTTGQFRLKWDPFISAQGFVDGATRAGKGGPHAHCVAFHPRRRRHPGCVDVHLLLSPGFAETACRTDRRAWLLGREIERRIEAFARACEDQALLAELRSQS